MSAGDGQAGQFLHQGPNAVLVRCVQYREVAGHGKCLDRIAPRQDGRAHRVFVKRRSLVSGMVVPAAHVDEIVGGQLALEAKLFE